MMKLLLLNLISFLFAASCANAHHSSAKAIREHALWTRGESSRTLLARDDLSTMQSRRIPLIVSSAVNATASNIQAWMSTLGSNGQWPSSEIDYTTGCNAQRANWPAQLHWQRINTMAAVYVGPVSGATQLQGQSDLLSATQRAMDWWFSNDFTDESCLDSGNTPSCPCGTPGLWNTNWFSSIIYVPTPVASTCLLLASSLSDTQKSNCSHIALRSYGTLGHNVNGAGVLGGSNLLQVAAIGVDNGLLTGNQTMLQDAYQRVHSQVSIETTPKTDGIQADGSFSQHAGLLYDGNYGKDFLNAVIQLEVIGANTAFQAPTSAQSAFESFIDGGRWMIYTNTKTNVPHWDFSTLGRFISFPVADLQATAGLNFNITNVQVLGNEWSSSTLQDDAKQLSQTSSSSANIGDLEGNRAFWNNDYMTHRGSSFVTTVKGFSNRTTNSECTNNQNPLGFHLADGTMYTYVTGDEYEDIAAAWDWNMIPGITTDYNATPLTCSNAVSSPESFVGSSSNGKTGAFVMRYTNPTTKNLSWQKSYFFFQNGVQHVMVSGITSKTSNPVYSILDQKKASGSVFVDGSAANSGNFTTYSSLWHSNVGYLFNASTASSVASLSVSVGQRSGSWSALGISTQPTENVNLFAAWLQHKSLDSAVGYTVYPGLDQSTFNSVASDTSKQVTTFASDDNAHGVLDNATKDSMIVFWKAGTSVDVPVGSCTMTIKSDVPSVVVVSPSSNWTVTASDPTQTLSSINLQVSTNNGFNQNFPFTLVTSNGLGGQGVTMNWGSTALAQKCPVTQVTTSSGKSSSALRDFIALDIRRTMFIVFFATVAVFI